MAQSCGSSLLSNSSGTSGKVGVSTSVTPFKSRAVAASAIIFNSCGALVESATIPFSLALSVFFVNSRIFFVMRNDASYDSLSTSIGASVAVVAVPPATVELGNEEAKTLPPAFAGRDSSFVIDPSRSTTASFVATGAKSTSIVSIFPN